MRLEDWGLALALGLSVKKRQGENEHALKTGNLLLATLPSAH